MTSIQSIKVSIVHLCSEVRRDVTRLRQQATDLAVSGSSQGQLKHSDTMLCSCSSVVIVGRVNGGQPHRRSGLATLPSVGAVP